MSFVEVSRKVYQDLRSSKELTKLLSNKEKSVYPLIASIEEDKSFIVYSIEDNGVMSKDGFSRWEVLIRSYAGDYDKSCEVADAVVNSFEASKNIYKNLGGKPFQSEEGWLFIEQRFNIKK